MKSIIIDQDFQDNLPFDNMEDFLVVVEFQRNAVREGQLKQKSALKTTRVERSLARKNLEMELLKTIHFIANIFPGDEKQAMSFFDFNLLFGARHKSLEDEKEVVV